MARKPAKPARRKPGTGSIRNKAGREKPWEAAFPIGRREYRYDSFATEAHARAHLDRLTAERDHVETPRNIAGGSQYLEAFLVAFLNRKAIKVKAKTLADYTYQCGLANEYYGVCRIDTIDRTAADALLLHYARRGYNNGSQLRMVMKQAFAYAVEEEYIKKNPFAKAVAPPVERRQGYAMTEAQRTRLLETVAGTPHAALWHLYSRLGLRHAEGLGLRWGDIDLERRTLSVAQQYTSLRGKIHKETPKTPKSRRTIPLPADVADLLRQHKLQQRQHAAQTPSWKEHGLVFASAVGTPIAQRNLMRSYKAILKRAGLWEGFTIHDLRHTADYLMERAGTPQSARMAILGHTTVDMDLHYTNHADMDDMRGAVG